MAVMFNPEPIPVEVMSDAAVLAPLPAVLLGLVGVMVELMRGPQAVS
jgi:hypothetical protein